MSYKSSYTGAQIDAALAKANTSLQDSGDQTITGGNLVIGTSGKGIDFSATGDGSGTVTSELLNDYEEGTWTPVFTRADSAPTIGYLIQNGHYTKIGRQVFVRGKIYVNSVSSQGAGYWQITGLPFTCLSDTAGAISYGTMSGNGLTAVNVSNTELTICRNGSFVNDNITTGGIYFGAVYNV